MDVEEDILVHT